MNKIWLNGTFNVYFISGLEQVNENLYSLFLITPSLKDDLKLKAGGEVRKDISFAFFSYRYYKRRKLIRNEKKLSMIWNLSCETFTK